MKGYVYNMAEEYVLPLKVIEQLKEELKELRTTGRTDIAEKINPRRRGRIWRHQV